MRNEKNGIPTHRFEDYEQDRISFEVHPISRMGADGHADYPHRHTFYEIGFVEQGLGTHFIDFSPHPIEPKTLYFLFPGQVHFWEVNRPLEGTVITFTEKFFLSSPPKRDQHSELGFFHGISGPPLFHLIGDQSKDIQELVQSLQEEYLHNDLDKAAAMRSYLRILILKARRILHEDQVEGHSTKHFQLVKSFKKMVSEDSLYQKEVSVYAEKLGISESRFYEIVKELTGKTPGQVIRDEIILKAKRQLAHSDLSISEICDNLHFGESSYFSRFFKRETGMSPRVFREGIRKKLSYLL